VPFQASYGVAAHFVFDEAELSAEFGHCLRDLSRAKDAAQHAERIGGASPDGRFARSDFFATMVLADSYLATGEAEQACGTALAAFAAGEQIRSGRCVNYLREFGSTWPRRRCGTSVSRLRGPG